MRVDLGCAVGAAVCVAAGPYLARLTLSVPDRTMRAWWRGRPVGRRRLAVTTACGAVLGALAGAGPGWSAMLAPFVALALVGTPLAVIDVEHLRLPNRLVGSGAAAALVLLTLAAAVRDSWAHLLSSVLSAAAVFALFGLLALLAPRALGFGDVKFAALLAGHLGWSGPGAVFTGLLTGFALGSLVALALVCARRATLGTEIAFGPMLLLGSLLVPALDGVG